MGREYFCASHEMLGLYAGLSDQEFGVLMRAALKYSATGELPVLKERVALLWPGVKGMVDKQVSAYEDKCRKNAENVRNRWKKNQAVSPRASEPVLYDRIRPYTTEYKNINKKNTPLTPQGDEVAAAMYDPGIAQAAQCWQENMGVLSPAVGQQLAEWVQLAEPGMVCAVIRYAVLAGKRDGRYIDSVIRNAAARNITTLAAWNAEQLERQHKNAPAGEEEKEVKRKWLNLE